MNVLSPSYDATLTPDAAVKVKAHPPTPDVSLHFQLRSSAIVSITSSRKLSLISTPLSLRIACLTVLHLES